MDLSNNDIHTLPVLNSIGTLTDLLVGGNALEFDDIEANLGISNFVYSPQDNVLIEKTSSRVFLNKDQTFAVNVQGVNNLYQWYKDNVAISGADQTSFTINDFSNADLGVYHVEVDNELATSLTISSDDFIAEISDYEQDSLIMVTMYQELDGTNWINQTNWLSDDLDSWFGVNVQNNRVEQLLLPNNGLAGKVPADISSASALRELDISQNSIQDTIPAEMTTMAALEILNLSNNPPKCSYFIRESYSGPESRPAGAFWAKQVISCKSKVACKCSNEKKNRIL